MKLHSGVHLIPWPHLSLKLSLVFTWLPPLPTPHPPVLINFSFFPLLVSIMILQNLTLNYWSHKVTKLLTIPELNSFHKTFTKSLLWNIFSSQSLPSSKLPLIDCQAFQFAIIFLFTILPFLSVSLILAIISWIFSDYWHGQFFKSRNILLNIFSELFLSHCWAYHSTLWKSFKLIFSLNKHF